MTELQVTIANLKDLITTGNRLLFSLEKQQKDLEKPKVPVFPDRFIVVRDNQIDGEFLIGLRQIGNSYPFGTWSEFPADFVGRVGFKAEDLRQIIKGLQTLLGDRQ